MNDERPARRGALLALVSAVLFGATTPIVQFFGRGVDAFVTAMLLYVGAAVAGALLRAPVQREARLQRTDAPWLVAAALCGAAVGPVALAWGLQHTSASSASLLLTLEAVFTAALARAVYRESMSGRATIALICITLGAMVLLADRGLSGTGDVIGLLAVLGATLAWAADNTLSRALSLRDPGQTVLAKALIGAGATASIALVSGAPLPDLRAALGLLGAGAIGYGMSLRLYLLAQRAFGAGRTASVFAFAPFIGALVAVAFGASGSTWLMGSAALMLAGVLLHIFERHGHVHTHEPIEHEHAHRHDDGHHQHTHDPMPAGPHSHRHRHLPMTHAHPHVPDAHHTHRH